MEAHIGNRIVGLGQRPYVVAELGQNHNGDVALALKMIDAASRAGADAVKFQKRTLEIAIPYEQRGIQRETPWGVMDYMSYRRRLEFEEREFDAIASYCARNGITWFASAWDLPALHFLAKYDTPAIKIPSACLTYNALLAEAALTRKPVILSTGMSTDEQVEHAVDTVLNLDITGSGETNLVLMWCKSAYPCPPTSLNLSAIGTLESRWGNEAVIGYSGHEVGLYTSVMAMALGASVIERHFTLNRAMWGTDQAASIEPPGLLKLCQQAQRWHEARGDGRIFVDPIEEEPMKRLRRFQ